MLLEDQKLRLIILIISLKLVVKASELAGQDNLLFIRNSQSGAIEARINSKSVALNQTLHKN